MTTPKNDIFIGLQLANCCLVGEGSESKFGWEGGVHWDGDFSRWEECANFQLVGGGGTLSNQNLKCTVFRRGRERED